MNDDRYLMISALQHHAFCPRQFALIHIEQVWEENRYTAEGKVLHERVDSGLAEQRGKIRFERSVLLRSERYGLTGKMDLLEIECSEPLRFIPVEYKRGKPKIADWDRIQLCAQALCIEEMRNTEVTEGAIWYWETRKRQNVVIDDDLRSATILTIEAVHQLVDSRCTPPPTKHRSRCRACSLLDLCEPHLFSKDRSAQYLSELFSDEKTA